MKFELLNNEVISDCSDDQENPKYDHSVVVFEEVEIKVYFANTDRRVERDLHRGDIHLAQLKEKATLLSHEDIWPMFPEELTRAPDLLLADAYLKRPSLTMYENMQPQEPAKYLLEEAKICETLKKFPHPNVAQYLGCKLYDDRIMGLYFVRYNVSLEDLVKIKDCPLDRDACLAGVEKGMKHIHSLGLAHNDLHPRNIMFKADDYTPIIIDFDSTAPIGKLLVKHGDFPLQDGDPAISDEKNDYYLLWQLKKFLDALPPTLAKPKVVKSELLLEKKGEAVVEVEASRSGKRRRIDAGELE